MRAALLAVRRALPPAERRRRDTAIAAALSPLVAGRSVVAAFLPGAREPGVPLRFRDDVRLLLPVLRPDNDLDWAADSGVSEAGRHGLSEPVGPRLGLDAVLGAELIVVPALAVDRRGTRLGRGGGSYDRVLARVAGRVPALAVVDAEEVLPVVPAEPHDRPVQGYVTPDGVYWI